MAAKETEPMTESFDPDGYRELMNTVYKNGVEFYLKHIHSVLESGRFKGTKCIEIGCGPTVHSLATATRFYDYIVTSDYLEVNRKYVEKWLKKEPGCADLSKYLRVVAELEGFSDIAKGQEEIEKRLRSKIKTVNPCDFYEDIVVPKEIFQEYDLLITSLAIEAACSNLEDFGKALRNVAKLIKKGEGLLIMGCMENTFWIVNGHRYRGMPFTADDITKELTKAGFGKFDLVTDHLAKNPRPDLADLDGIYFVAAEKL